MIKSTQGDSMKKLLLIIGLSGALFMSGCNTILPQTPKSQEVVKKDKVVQKNVPTGYKLVKLKKLHLSLAVPKKWKIQKEKLYGEWHYFIGTIDDVPEARIDSAEIWDTFQTNTYNIHGIHLRTIYGTMKSFDVELNTMTPRYPVVYDKDLSTKTLVLRSVLKKSPYSGYYQFYAIGSKKKFKRGVVMEMASKLYVDKNDETKFHDRADRQEIDTIIKSIKPYKSF
jgi:hypothetical protein